MDRTRAANASSIFTHPVKVAVALSASFFKDMTHTMDVQRKIDLTKSFNEIAKHQ